jgi:two-component system CheB/CheR fusion protein
MTTHRILVIDDKRDAVAAMQCVLELCGHEVDVAYDGAEGLERARNVSPEVILCDIGLPGAADGYQVARALRASDEFRSTFLVAVTGHAGEEDAKRAVAAGFDLHLAKPIDVHTLLRLISERFEDGPE